jgi:hypothetical protein
MKNAAAGSERCFQSNRHWGVKFEGDPVYDSGSAPFFVTFDFNWTHRLLPNPADGDNDPYSDSDFAPD